MGFSYLVCPDLRSNVKKFYSLYNYAYYTIIITRLAYNQISEAIPRATVPTSQLFTDKDAAAPVSSALSEPSVPPVKARPAHVFLRVRTAGAAGSALVEPFDNPPSTRIVVAPSSEMVQALEMFCASVPIPMSVSMAGTKLELEWWSSQPHRPDGSQRQ